MSRTAYPSTHRVGVPVRSLAFGAPKEEASPADIEKPGTPVERGRWFPFLLLVLWLVAAGAATAWGLDYYLTPLQDRPYAPGHELFKPAGTVGHGWGILGTLMMAAGVGLYSARKRLHALRRLGRLKHWLQFHIFLCTLGPYLVLLHTTFRFGGLVAISFWSMVVVVTSGVFGRYVYVHIPKTLNGRFHSVQAVRSRQEYLRHAFVAATGLVYEAVVTGTAPEGGRSGIVRALVAAVRFDVTKRRRRRDVGRRLTASGVDAATRNRVEGLVTEHQVLEQQLVLMTPFKALFGYWHVLHLPLALVMLLVLGVHVVVAVLFGYHWLF